jgi:hypothetical protein
MTVTREYFESLIDIFSRLVKVPNDHINEFMSLKKELHQTVDWINKFNLFPLTFSETILTLITGDKCTSLPNEKLLIINELNFELHECLYTTRLRYGGELMQYLLKLKLILLELQYEEFDMLRLIQKPPAHYQADLNPALTDQPGMIIQKAATKKALASLKPKLARKKPLKRNYERLEAKLLEHLREYQRYIFEQYPRIAEEFKYYNKNVRAYLTEAMSSNSYELRIHSYQSSAEWGISVKKEYYDFYPAYFYNLEEIPEKQVAAMVVSLDRDTLNIQCIFEKAKIHSELLDIFISNSAEKDIVDFCAFLLKSKGYHVREAIKTDKNVDLQGSHEGRGFIAEIFHRRSRELNELEHLIQRIKAVNPEQDLYFIFSTPPSNNTLDLLAQHQVTVITLEQLYIPHFAVRNSDVIHWYIKDKLQSLLVKSEATDLNAKGGNLIEQLKICPKGDKSWTAYEQLGVKIFEFLFSDQFKKYLIKSQAQTDTKSQRRDLLINNNFKDSASFWADQKSIYQCQAIIVDFKNYTEKLNSTTLTQVLKYMTANLGNFAIILCREGVDATALNEQKKQLASGRLILELSDDDLIQMIREKMIGKDPIDLLESKKFLLIRSL